MNTSHAGRFSLSVIGRLAALVVVLSVCVTASGQASGVTAAETPDRVEVRFMALRGLETRFALAGPAGRERIVARGRGFGEPMTARVREGRVDLFPHAAAAVPPAPGAAPQPPAGSFAVMPGVVRYLAIIAASGPEACAVHVIPDMEGAHPQGHVRIMNFTGEELAVRFDRASSIIAPGGSAVVAAAGEADGHAAFQYARRGGEDGWRLEGSTRLNVGGGSRLFVMLTPTATEREDPSGQLAAAGAFQVRPVFDR